MANQNPSLRIGLLDNSSHSLKRGYELWSLWRKTEDAWLLKESIIWIHHGIELSLKQLLAQTNAFLVFENVDAAIENLGKLRKKVGMENAGVIDLFDNNEKIKSVGFQNLIERAAVALSIPELTKNAALREKIDELTKFRNKVVHFSIELEIAEVSSLLSEIHDPLLIMLEREVKDDNFVRNQIPEIRKLALPLKKYGEELRQEIVENAIKATEYALPPKGNRRAGIVWQTIGTGLGRTLVDYLLQVQQLPVIRDHHIIIITDNVELSIQAHHLLSNAALRDKGMQVNLPESGAELTQILESSEPKIIISTIQKFTKNSIQSNKEVLLIGYKLHGFSNFLPTVFPNATHILFTSTPPQKDSLSWMFFGNLIGKYDFDQAIADHVALPVKIEYRKFSNAADLASLAQNQTNADIVTSFDSQLFTAEHITLLSKDIIFHFDSRQNIFNGKAIILAPNISSGSAFSKTIANIQHGNKLAIAISSMTNPAEREELVKRFKNPDDPFCLLIATGGFPLYFDNPLIHTVYVTSPISLQSRLQLAGRISRPHVGKNEAVIVDYVGLDWSLDVLL